MKEEENTTIVTITAYGLAGGMKHLCYPELNRSSAVGLDEKRSSIPKRSTADSHSWTHIGKAELMRTGILHG